MINYHHSCVEQKEALIAELRIELRAAEERLHAKKRGTSIP